MIYVRYVYTHAYSCFFVYKVGFMVWDNIVSVIPSGFQGLIGEIMAPYGQNDTLIGVEGKWK